MDNLYFKKLPGENVPAVTGNEAIIVETNGGALMWADVSGNKELATKQYTDGTGAIHYMEQNLTLTVSAGVHIITDCTGTVTMSGNAGTVYISNSPGLTVTGVTLDNWDKVYRDGLASYTYPINIVRTLDTIALNETISTEVGPAALRAEKISLRFSIVKQSLASIGFDLDLVYSAEYNAYDGAIANNLSNGTTGFPDWVSMSFALTNNGLRFMLRPYPAETNYSVHIYELYMEKRS